ncbi:hypothetical protein [Sebaldella sp. S0638]|uniref:hypothetical protein n=1 Tax=Sebaldella sp. S0638 TaxID=2957809 RepID=UPI00209CF108|nr:hypothetical protein [Sebaldella sp. S0638]MCP1226619.1 hypothetical protein [Sebaldella sp. S0638]
MKNKGSLLLEFLLNIFIFSVIMLLLLTFMKRAVIIQNYKNKVRVNSENTLYILDILKKNIKERDKENFLYKEKNSNIFIINENIISSVGNSILYKSGGEFYLIKFNKPKMLISSAKTPEGFLRHDNLAFLDSLEFQIRNSILFVKYEINGNITEQVINLK